MLFTGVEATTSSTLHQNENGWDKDYLNHFVQNAAIASEAAYSVDEDGELLAFLNRHSQQHGFVKVFKIKHGQFIIAEEEEDEGEENRGRIYVAFRGTYSRDDWKTNMKANLESNNSIVEGQFHSGFLERASEFPMETLLNREEFRHKDVIMCGHSLGGAIATIVTILLMASEKERGEHSRTIKCVTFGSPMVGDDSLKAWCVRNNISPNMYHFVHDQDPVPRVFSLAQNLTSSIGEVITSFTSRETADAYKALIDQYSEILPKVLDLLEFALGEAANQYLSGTDALPLAKLVTSFVRRWIETSEKNLLQAYSMIGNFAVYSDNELQKQFLDHLRNERELVEMPNAEQLTKAAEHHMMKRYRFFIVTQSRWKKAYNPVDGRLTLVEKFVPEITKSELLYVTDDSGKKKNMIKLRVWGHNIGKVNLERCYLGYFFSEDRGQTTIKEIGHDTEECILFEQERQEPPTMPSQGIEITLVNHFGEIQHTVKDCTNLTASSAKQILMEKSLLSLISSGIQRGMALSQVRRDMDKVNKCCPTYERLTNNIGILGELFVGTLGRSLLEDVNTLLKPSEENKFHKDVSSKISTFSKKVEECLNRPFTLVKLELSAKQKLVVLGVTGVSFVLGGGVAIAGAVAVAAGEAAVTASMSGFVLSSLSFAKFTNVDGGYRAVLDLLVQEFKMDLDRKMNPFHRKLLCHVENLTRDRSLNSLETAVCCLFDAQMSLRGLFHRVDLQKRIQSIRAINDIRDILATQCFVGIVGLQNAGMIYDYYRP